MDYTVHTSAPPKLSMLLISTGKRKVYLGCGPGISQRKAHTTEFDEVGLLRHLDCPVAIPVVTVVGTTNGESHVRIVQVQHAQKQSTREGRKIALLDCGEVEVGFGGTGS